MRGDIENPSFAPGLNRWQFLAILGFGTGLFLFICGPVWKNGFDATRSILFSYIPLPFATAACLAWNRSFSIKNFLLASFCVMGFKYLVTAAILLTIIFIQGPRANPQGTASIPAWYETPGTDGDMHTMEGLRAEIDLLNQIPQTPIDATRTATLQGTVVGRNGVPASGALIYISNGLENYHFTLPRTHQRFSLGPGGIEPPLAAVRYYQPLDFSARDRTAHTVMAVTDRRGFIMNRPLLKPATLCFPRRAAGPARLPQFQKLKITCAMHEREAGDLFVIAHPYFTFADAEGRFTIPGVPVDNLTGGRVSLGSYHTDFEPAHADCTPSPGTIVKIDLAPGTR